jgi:UDP-2,4-diacetamido-2,4,6-trideoxy-beta-L-altropyranose hydrolase
MSRAFLRVDASRAMGSGHVMRCLALAEALQDAGVEPVFVCAPWPGDLRGELQGRGHAVRTLRLPTDSPWSAAADAAATAALLQQEAAAGAWLVVDHYGLDAAWHRAVAASGVRVAVIDDLADRPLAGELLVDQNVVEAVHHRYPALTPSGCVRLLGPAYSLLRRDVRLAAAARAERAAHVLEAGPTLVFLGGADADGLTAHVLSRLAARPHAGPVHVLAGAMNPHQAALREQCRALGHDFSVARRDLAALMAESRAAIVACGMFAVELQAVGVPCLLLPLSGIQAEVAAAFAARGRAVVLPPEALADARRFDAAWQQVLSLPLAGATARPVAAPDGAARIVRHLLGRPIPDEVTP